MASSSINDVSTMLRQGISPSSPLSVSRFSPPPSSPSKSLFQIISTTPHRPPPPPASSHRRLRLVNLITRMIGTDHTLLGPADVELSVSSEDGFRFTMLVHRLVLAKKSRLFKESLGKRSGGRVAEVEICGVGDVEVYVEVVALMYVGEVRRWIEGVGVNKVLGLLKVSADIMFDDGVVACLEYLEAIPWSEAEEEEVVSVLSQLHFHDSVTEVLQRVSTVLATVESANALFSRLLDGILQSKDDKARRDMKALIKKLLGEDKMVHNPSYSDQLDVSRETLYHFCRKCLNTLYLRLSEAANIDASRWDRGTIMGEIAREADNVQWLLEILIVKKMADEFVMLWADQTELAGLHSKIPCMYRYEISKITAQLGVALGRRQILVPKDARFSLLQTWLEPLYDDFSWMKRACRNFDNKMVEDGLCQTILTLPMAQQQGILLRWFDRFLKKSDDCPNIQKAFEVWWRRAFIRQNVVDQDQSQLQIALGESMHDATSI